MFVLPLFVKTYKKSYVCTANNHRQKKAACSEPTFWVASRSVKRGAQSRGEAYIHIYIVYTNKGAHANFKILYLFATSCKLKK
jgi:hypothetical protein